MALRFRMCRSSTQPPPSATGRLCRDYARKTAIWPNKRTPGARREQARTNGYVMVLENPTAGKISVTGCPVTLNGDVTHDAAPASEHGQYTEEALLRSVTGRNRGTARAQGDMTINILTDAPQ